jgi:hypothetical protein
MSSIYKYKIYCITDSQFEYTWANNPPSICPVNSSHTVNSNSISDVDNGLAITILPTDSPFNATSDVMLCNTATSSITVNMPNAILGNQGVIRVKKISANNSVNIQTVYGELINGSSSYTLTTNDSLAVFTSNGTNWLLVNPKDEDSYISDITKFNANKTSIQTIYDVRSNTDRPPIIGVTGSFILNSGNGGISGTTFMKYIDNTLNFNGNTGLTMSIDRQTSLITSGTDMIIQAGSAANGATNQYGGSLILRAGVITGGGTGTLNSFVQIQQPIKQTVLTGVTATIDSVYIPTCIYLPIRNIATATNYDIIRFNFNASTNTAVSCIILLTLIAYDGSTSMSYNSGRAIAIRQVTNTITNTNTAIFADVKIPSGAGSPAVTWSTVTGTNQASVRINFANLIANPTFQYVNIKIDNLLYSPNNTIVTLNHY